MPRLRSLAVAVVVAMVVSIVPMVTTMAAGPWTGVAVDSPDLEPLGGGVQALFAPPTHSVTTAEPSASHAVISVAAAGWTFRFEERAGLALDVATYTARTVTGESGYHGMAVEGPGPTSCDARGSFQIREISWTGSEIASLAIDLEYICAADTPTLTASIRIESSIPIIAAANDPDVVDLGETVVGTPGSTTTMTVSNIGQAPLPLGDAYIDGSRRGTSTSSTTPAAAWS